jgi:hypothetical protein
VQVGHKARDVLTDFRRVCNETVSNYRYTCVNDGFGDGDGCDEDNGCRSSNHEC